MTRVLAILVTGSAVLAGAAGAQGRDTYQNRVEIRRTSYGVPHILAQDLAALGYGLAWVQLEDYGAAVVVNFIRARGELAKYFGRDSLESDFEFKRTYRQMQSTYDQLHPDTRAMFEGFAAATNRWVELHPDVYSNWQLPLFSGRDAAALWVDETVYPQSRRFRRALDRKRAEADSLRRLGAGSNAWAFAPSRTTSGNAILLRNPHLNWRAGYYEAHITVPGVINFYGDFRIGYPLSSVGLPPTTIRTWKRSTPWTSIRTIPIMSCSTVGPCPSLEYRSPSSGRTARDWPAKHERLGKLRWGRWWIVGRGRFMCSVLPAGVSTARPSSFSE